MKQLLAGVSQISFNITVDTASLEFAAAPEALQPALRIRAPLPMESECVFERIVANSVCMQRYVNCNCVIYLVLL